MPARPFSARGRFEMAHGSVFHHVELARILDSDREEARSCHRFGENQL
jgi:hypothetical protein